MNCDICGSEMRPVVTDLPFKTGPNAIVIIKSLPVLQCSSCREYLIEDSVMERVEEMLARVATDSELEVIRFAA